MNEQLAQENKQLNLRFLEQKQQLDEIKDRMRFYTKVHIVRFSTKTCWVGFVPLVSLLTECAPALETLNVLDCVFSILGE